MGTNQQCLTCHYRGARQIEISVSLHNLATVAHLATISAILIFDSIPILHQRIVTETTRAPQASEIPEDLTIQPHNQTRNINNTFGEKQKLLQYIG